MIGGTIVYFGVEDCAVEESRIEASGGQVIKPKMSIGEFGFVCVCAWIPKVTCLD
ncbi:VOC family protein [Enterovibrio norvegicus]|uniref:VOC family protein n=1 Tax=Enterovibrio norvegicus TaxID=188144 RepID=UPI00352DC1DE